MCSWSHSAPRLTGALALLIAAAGAAAQDVPLRVLYGDCRTVLSGPVCVLPESSALRLWIDAPVRADIAIEVDGAPAAADEAGSAPPGTRWRVRLPEDDVSTLTVTAALDGASARWTLPLTRETDPPLLARIGAGIRGGDRSEPAWRSAAAADIEATLADPAWRRRGQLLRYLAQLQRLDRDMVAATATLQAAQAASLAEGRPLEALRTTSILAWTLIKDLRRLDEAARVYDVFETLQTDAAEARYFPAYFLAIAAKDAGDARTALAQFDRARRAADQMGWERRAFDTTQSMAIQLAQMGRRGEALALLRRWEHEPLPAALRPCERGKYWNNLGWLAVLLLEAGERADDPQPWLERSLALHRQHDCDPNSLVHAWVNLALAHFHAGRYAAAQESLDAARAATDEPEVENRLWWYDVAARVALRQGDDVAASAFVDTLDALSQSTLSYSALWRGTVARAQIHEHRGDTAAALAAYARADAQLDEDLFRLAFDAGREPLIAGRERVQQHYIAMLLEHGQQQAALDAVRRHHARLLATLEVAPSDEAAEAREAYRALRADIARDIASTWALSRSEQARLAANIDARERDARARLDAALRGGESAADVAPAALANGEVRLSFHPLADGWAVFVETGRGLQVQRGLCANVDGPHALGQCLVGALNEPLTEASVVVISTPATLHDADLHGARLGDRTLVEHAPVRYALGIRARGAQSAVGTRALLVVDPRGDLLGARAEADAVEDLLGGAPDAWQIARIDGAAATGDRLLQAVRDADLFHFAGHAWYGGRGGWDSHLKLASDTVLTVRDILSLERAPRLVVLSGCETAAVGGSAAIAGIGLAQAFIAAGTEHVVAATRPIPDTAARDLADHFYRALNAGADPAGALRTAQIALARATPDADWRAFRVLTR